MLCQVIEADLNNPFHCQGLIEVLNSYASDPAGGGQPLSLEVKNRLPSVLKNRPLTVVGLALVDKKIVGIAICFLGLSTFLAKPLLNIHDLAVLPGMRGKGIGRALLAFVEKRALELGCCKLTLEVQDDNLPAKELYKNFGFADFVVGDSLPTKFLSKPLL